jgi:DNA-binding transcriptional MerR regulator
MIKIGDFARLSQVSVVTLRYYDEMELLKPVKVDSFTGYRFYSAEQLPLLNRILALKDLGFSLEQIKLMLTDDLTLEQLRGMLKVQRNEVEKHVEDEQERLLRIEARLRQIELEDKMSQQCWLPRGVSQFQPMIRCRSTWGQPTQKYMNIFGKKG